MRIFKHLKGSMDILGNRVWFSKHDFRTGVLKYYDSGATTIRSQVPQSATEAHISHHYVIVFFVCKYQRVYLASATLTLTKCHLLRKPVLEQLTGSWRIQ